MAGTIAPAAKAQSSRPPLVRPFLKWAGGKGRLLGQYADLFPDKMGNYHEPFLGSGAVFFFLRPRISGEIHLSDRIDELILTYRTVRDDVAGVIRRLKKHVYDRDYYYRIRAQNPARLSAAGRAARLIYLNRTGFNGLYRVNRSGQFNVPFGRYVNPTICDEKGLRQASESLANAEIERRSFVDLAKYVKKNGFVYLDPPYHPLSKTSNFTSYTPDTFGEDEQRALAEVCRALHARGARFMLSNSDTPFVRKIYKGFDVRRVYASRAINASPNRRGKVPEVVVRNYD